ncbi:helix-turn-helix domain-containing protein [Streptococcus gallolyticus]|nr:helix-turn-helix domain-containing protein [Streptococcus gallolyticus]MBY5040431.1 helix-turn-helix domain-containing protein [Streptococcus gallolyticus]
MNRLKELRQEKKLSQKELAKKIGVHYRTLQNWENSESQIKPDKAQALADHFGVTVAYLLGYSDYQGDNLRDLLFHEIKALKEYKVIRNGFENFISENAVLNVIDRFLD